VLVAVGALSVDLGNAWARGRTVQKQADVVAIGTGSLLPMQQGDADHDDGVIADFAADLLNQNKAQGQLDAVGSELLDGAYGNGEVEFYNSAGVDCDDNCVQMRLTPPSAEVDFALAGAVGFSGGGVMRSATVRVFSELPAMEKVIPLWLPSGCGYGPVDGDTDQGGGPPAPTTTAPSPTDTGTGTASASPTGSVVIDPRGAHTISGPTAYTMAYGASLDIKNLSITNVSNGQKKASVRAVSPDGNRYVEYAAADIKVNAGTFSVSDFTIGTEVSLTPGVWKLYAMVRHGNDDEYSANEVTITVTGGPGPGPTDDPSPSATESNIPVGCVGQDRGNFGQLDSPRNDGTNHGSLLAVNMAAGLDHLIIPFDTQNYTVEKECAQQNGNNVIDGGQIDDVSRAGNNCIIGDTGNDGPQWYDGLITGVGSYPGRLEVAAGQANCTGATRDVNGRTINDDKLSCFLRNGATLATIAQESGVDDSMLDPSILESPRFVWLPMVYATDRAQKGYQPIIDYVAAFITDETPTQAASGDNGIEISGNSISTIQLYAFHKAALPVGEQSPDVDYNTTLGRPIVRLVG
jgi:hypothetical protein